ncbi:hypothetical protein Tco_0598345 [Tanacetum coccineum]
MTRSSTKELVTPYKETKQVFRSSRKLFMTRSIARLKINDKAHFELKGQFLKELRDNTFSGSDNEDANKHIENVLEIVDLFQIPEVTQDQIMLRVFPMSLTKAESRWLRNEPTGLINTWETLKKKFLSKYYPPARTAKTMEEINNFQQEPNETLYQAWEHFKELLLRCTSDGLAAIQAQLNNLGKEIKKVNEKFMLLKLDVNHVVDRTTLRIVHLRKKGDDNK